MKSRPTQFGVRENTASSRQHALRLAVNSSLDQSQKVSRNPNEAQPMPVNVPREVETFDLPLTDTQNRATGEDGEEKNHLLTIREVADLLQVAVSWVYGHTRQRCPDRVPGIRLGKYWRFHKADVIAWLDAKRTKDYHRAVESR